MTSMSFASSTSTARRSIERMRSYGETPLRLVNLFQEMAGEIRSLVKKDFAGIVKPILRSPSAT